MSNIKVQNPNEATDNCPKPFLRNGKHTWRLVEGKWWECACCGAIGIDEDAILAGIGVIPVQTAGTIPAAAPATDGKEQEQ